MLGKAKTGKATLLAAALGGILLLGGVATAQDRDRDDRCVAKVRKAEQRLDQAVNKYGEHSRQADKRRRELDQQRDRCPAYRDHDRDRDRDKDRDRDRDHPEHPDHPDHP
jgi:pre-mRNA-processing factor 40